MNLSSLIDIIKEAYRLQGKVSLVLILIIIKSKWPHVLAVKCTEIDFHNETPRFLKGFSTYTTTSISNMKAKQ